MAINQETPVQITTANGATVSFPYAFTVFLDTDLQVTGLPSGATTPTVYRLGTDYTVSGVGASSGTVVFSTAPANGTVITIRRAIKIERLTSYQQNGDMLAETVNRDFDRIVAMIADESQRTSDAGSGLPISWASGLPFSPTATIPASNTQAAIETVDTNARTAAASTNGNVSSVTSRVTALEATASVGVIGKADLATLNASLGYAADTIAYVTNDATAANNGVYRKVGASGSGSWVQSSMTPGAVDTAVISKAAYAMASEVPVLGGAVVAIKVAPDRWVIRTPVSGGEPHDYAEYVMFNMGAYQAGGGAISHAWSLHSIRAMIGGVLHKYMEQDPIGPSVGTNEFAMYVGTDGANLTAVGSGGTYDYYGYGHGWMNYLGLSIVVDGAGTNYRDLAPVGTVLRGATFTFDASFAPKTAAGTVIGTCGVSHIFDANGLTVAQQHIITQAGIYCQNSYSAMLNSTGVTVAKGAGSAAITINKKDSSQSASLGKVGSFAFYMAARPTNLLEVVLPYGGPISGGSWAGDTTSDTFVVNNTNGVSKFYCNWRSGPSPVSYFGTYNFLTKYRVRVGAAL